MSICNAFSCRGQKSIFNNKKVDIFEDKYPSQDLSCILHNTDRLYGGQQQTYCPVNPLLPLRVAATQQTRDTDTVLA